jgi:glutathionyl-hydroquinone reductase
MRNFLNRMDTIITTLFDCKIVTINSYKIAQWLTTKKSAFLSASHRLFLLFECVGAAGCQRNKNWVTYFGIKMRKCLNRMDTIITTLFDCKIVTINSYKIAQWLTTKKISFSECVA